jgi:hypothetical protein
MEPLEWLKNISVVIGVDANAVIFNHEDPVVISPLGGDTDHRH